MNFHLFLLLVVVSVFLINVPPISSKDISGDGSNNGLCARISISNSAKKYEVPKGQQYPRSSWDELTSGENAAVDFLEVDPDCSLRICHLSYGNVHGIHKCDTFQGNKNLTTEDTKTNDIKWDRTTSSVLGIDCHCGTKPSCNNNCEKHSITDKCQCATLFLDEDCDDCNYNPIPLFVGSPYSRKNNLSVISSVFIRENCVVHGNNGTDHSRVKQPTFTFLRQQEDRRKINGMYYNFESFDCSCNDINFAEDCQVELAFDSSPQFSILVSLVGLAVLIVILITILLVDRWVEKYKSKKDLYSVLNNLDKKWIILEEELEIDYETILGKGRFGKVFQGKLKRTQGQTQTVAVKEIRSSSMDSKYFSTLAREIENLSIIESHPNVVSMIGVVFKNNEKGSEALLVLEYCKHNSLERFLRKHRSKFLYSAEGYLGISTETPGYSEFYDISLGNYIEEPNETELPCEYLGLQNLTQWACDIACGMEHVSSKNIVHIDLAVRNILLDENLTAKVSDFGLSKIIDENSQYYYKPPIKHPLPTHQMAVETMKSFKFSLKSDIWAYGVCLWELFTLGEMPYSDVQMETDIMTDLLSKIDQGYRLPKPDMCTSEVFKIIQDCWNAEPLKRPDFTKLKEFFLNYLQLQKENIVHQESIFQFYCEKFD